MQVNVQFLQQLQPEAQDIETDVKQRQEIDTVSYHKLFDVLKQFQKEVNDIRSERLARRSNLSNVPSSSNSLADCTTHPIHLHLHQSWLWRSDSRECHDQRVNYVEGLQSNLFSVGQFCDADLEVAFRKSTCFVRDLQGNDLLTGNRGSDLYTISLQETTSSTPICFMAKASPTQACKAKEVHSIQKLPNFQKKAKFASHGLVWSNVVWQSINGKKFKRNLHSSYTVRNCTEARNFMNNEHSMPISKKKALSIKHPLLELLNRTALSKDGTVLLLRLLETMLSASKLPLSFWLSCCNRMLYSNQSITPYPLMKDGAYHIINDRKLQLIIFTSLVDLYNLEMGKSG
ncbi:hypothetical protein Tco_0273636 [Tanacetum coccineum]